MGPGKPSHVTPSRERDGPHRGLVSRHVFSLLCPLPPFIGAPMRCGLRFPCFPKMPPRRSLSLALSFAHLPCHVSRGRTVDMPVRIGPILEPANVNYPLKLLFFLKCAVGCIGLGNLESEIGSKLLLILQVGHFFKGARESPKTTGQPRLNDHRE